MRCIATASTASCWAALSLGCLIATMSPTPARAFCGFYVAGADTSLYANATMVVLMRDGTHTVLSMQNNYQGPPEEFALVIPVPTVLRKDQVKILPEAVFGRVDALGAPRLVEYFEADPCLGGAGSKGGSAGSGGAKAAFASADAGASSKVVVEAQFTVGEYDVSILSASDSSALESWLHDNKYNIPTGAGPILAPYVAAGTKFFVAKVDPKRVMFVDGQAALSPLRFDYDTPEFSLPVRLGLLNSQGTQDLIINILASDRYESANYPNVTIPTNIHVQSEVRDNFPSFFEALFAQLMTKNPGAVVTEYAWASSTCDPCPTTPLAPSDLATLGADVTKGLGGDNDAGVPVALPVGGLNYTLTRLHYRYTKESLGDDLVFKKASPIVGGRGIPNNEGGLDQTVQTLPSGVSNFQGRYVMLQPWSGAIACAKPIRGRWGGPGGRATPTAMSVMNSALQGSAPKSGNLGQLLGESLPAIDAVASNPIDLKMLLSATRTTDGGVNHLDAGNIPSVEAKKVSEAVSGGGRGCDCSVAARKRASLGSFCLPSVAWLALWRLRRRRRLR
jgi:hypothetical protein